MTGCKSAPFEIQQGRASAAYGFRHAGGPHRYGEKVIINIKTWVDGHNPPDRVLPSMPKANEKLCCTEHKFAMPLRNNE